MIIIIWWKTLNRWEWLLIVWIKRSVMIIYYMVDRYRKIVEDKDDMGMKLREERA